MVGVMLSSASAQATDIRQTGRFGLWWTFQGTNSNANRVCGLGTSFGDGRDMAIRWIQHPSEGASIRLSKPTWRIPSGTVFTVRMAIDRVPPLTLMGLGNEDAAIFPLNEAVSVFPEGIASFLDLVRNGLHARISFNEGTEADWFASLRGSGAAVNEFLRCFMTYANAPDSQPFSPRRSQPFNSPSQPFSSGSQPFDNRSWSNEPPPTDGGQRRRTGYW